MKIINVYTRARKLDVKRAKRNYEFRMKNDCEHYTHYISGEVFRDSSRECEKHFSPKILCTINNVETNYTWWRSEARVFVDPHKPRYKRDRNTLFERKCWCSNGVRYIFQSKFHNGRKICTYR